jgi:hypothetical protein
MASLLQVVLRPKHAYKFRTIMDDVSPKYVYKFRTCLKPDPI